MRKKILFSLLAGVMALTWNPIESSAEASCEYSRCHSVGTGYCLPGHQISLRSRCTEEFACLLTMECGWTFDIEAPEMN